MVNQIKRDGYTLCLSQPKVYVDNQARGRSGHMSHALSLFSSGRLIDFNSNCSAKRLDGHAAYGWIEYRFSDDGGRTYGDVMELPISKEAFLDGLFTISVEKTVVCDDDRIVAFCLRNDPLRQVCCEPWLTPWAVTSFDGGLTWTTPTEVTPFEGRIYDALYRDGVIYVLEYCNDAKVHFTGNLPEHVYRLFISRNNGESYENAGVLPIDWEGRGYGSMVFDNEGKLHIYAYNVNREREMDHIVSADNGQTWQTPGPCYLPKGIRNPQVNIIDGIFILHGRGEKGHGFVLYSSRDGYVWDEGTYLEEKKGWCYYSNNIVLQENGGENYLLIQYSDTYENAAVNVMHMELRIR